MANKIAALAEELVSGMLEENGLLMWDCEFVKEGRDWFLRLYIDRTDGKYVSTDDCEAVSKYLSEALDERDPIEQNYYLEVSSPGMDRELVKPEHFEACMGNEVEVRTYVPLQGEARLLSGEGEISLKELKIKEFNAYLTGYDREEGTVKLQTVIDTKAMNRKPGAKVSPDSLKEVIMKLSLKDIAKINLAVNFE